MGTQLHRILPAQSCPDLILLLEPQITHLRYRVCYIELFTSESPLNNQSASSPLTFVCVPGGTVIHIGSTWRRQPTPKQAGGQILYLQRRSIDPITLRASAAAPHEVGITTDCEDDCTGVRGLIASFLLCLHPRMNSAQFRARGCCSTY